MLFGDRYEAAWGSLRSQSESVTLRTEQLAKTVEQAAARCGAACDGLERLHGELEQPISPSCSTWHTDGTLVTLTLTKLNLSGGAPPYSP